MTEQPKRICILGGGFGGLYTALRLSQLPWEKPDRPEIVLVDRNDRFIFSPLLYELLTGELQTWEIAPPFEEILANTGVRFIQGTVAEVQLEEKRVRLREGQALSYDRLVLALGGETPLDRVPGAAEYAIPFRNVTDAYRLAEKLRSLLSSDADKIRIAIVGAGYSGVELACKLADRLGERGRLRLVEMGDTILRTSPDFNRETARTALTQRGVWIDFETTVDSLSSDTIALTYKGQTDTIPVDIVLWTVGTEVAPAIKTLPLKKNARGQLTTHPTLQVIDYPEVFAVGDLADIRDATGQLVPTTAQAAFQEADYCAWNLWASLSDRPLLPLRYQNLGEMMTLGVDNATLCGLGLKLEGPLAQVARRLVYLYRLPTLNHQVKVGLNWISQPLQSFLLNT
ncbi:NAD(P)/FAD-dependent oxidoreductase [Desertifilum sp. FACHB-1129]|uniref:demethylphylloquinone reductase n=1 Tax=Desertifilum tharense IPPAS B-1220 TaxID=1781255 RepID=A0A1E5QFW5_9CYAN|nr:MULTISPECIES: NAD(P)/FAD-dependent oxidoreductase [Desertifilum]MDA0213273.1 NAD(P)/FAD-dependent oxidoreductase [Cyanobacteria bacterium FC1]MBD2310335.1 NAD(P)/FAD-dependent oxidoreductase [Desertifilum sp. FACHB-1129]MBD2321786.1 NAD(P)/FAD-dependent oxidoreductase [Desertifilum sp. FACHB-866]MBD2331913.1 NAD(P)/FAD-dependent oxidoreductase [Desertifilum sp. FACHB-868]OEJ73491.1 NADH dehydrogenase [Desertifilum tharense IPPAS B-1220]